MADELLVQKVSIYGPTLASIIQRFASSPGDVDGLLFGHVTRLPPPDLNDDDPAAAGPAPSPFAAIVTGHFCSGAPMSFYDPLGRVDRHTLDRAAGGGGHPPSDAPLLGWFSGRRRSPLRPSMREHAVSLSLSKTLTLEDRDGAPRASRSDPPDPLPRPCVFLLLSSSTTQNQAVHTHEYRAFVLSPSGGSLEPRSLDVVNVGPAFRGQYSSFSPESAFPLMPCRMVGLEEGDGGNQNHDRESLNLIRQSAREQQLMDSLAEGFDLERLKQLVGPGAAEYTYQVENLYRRMLHKLESLARLVEKSSAKVLEQENRNLMLRGKLAGLWGMGMIGRAL